MSTQRTQEIVVVGGGIIGLACAWRLAREGHRPKVLERGEIGSGASGIAAGMLAPATEADFGDERLLELNLQSRAMWPAFAAELSELTGLSTGYEEVGALVVAADRDDVAELRRVIEFHARIGLDSEWLTPRSARAAEPGLSPRIGGAIHARGDGWADPQAVVDALAAGVRAGGGEILTGIEAVGLEAENGRVVAVRDAQGSRHGAETVVMAAGAWTSAGELALEIDAPEVRPVKGQLLELAVRPGHPAPARMLIRSPRCYLLPRSDGRIVLGATTEEQGFDTTVTADGVFRLLEAAYEICPDVAELELVRARAGLRPATPANMPVIGPGAIDGLVWACGHGRNGVLLAPLTARAVTEAVGGRELPAAVRSLESV